MKTLDVQVDIVPRLFEAVGPRVGIHAVEGMPLVGLPPARPSQSSLLMKRVLDVVLASAALVVTAPLFAYVAWRIEREARPARFSSGRSGSGRNMEPFTLLKFRTMRDGIDESVHEDYIKATMSPGAAPEASGVYKLERGGDITKVGAWLRATSLDELPQLLNVVKGDMSLVGPRPCLRYETEQFSEHQFERFLMPAGLTGLWQVTARAHSTFFEALEMDVAYVRGWSLGARPVVALPHSAPGAQADGNGMSRRNGTGRRLGVGVIGLGYWGPNLVRNLHELDGVEVVVMSDLDAEALDKVGARYPAVRRTTRAEELIADPDVEAVAIATPVGTHYRLARAALEAGKHVFVEKPLAASNAEATELVQIADAAGLVLMPGHTFLYSPPVTLIRDLISSGELGEIYFISTSRVNLGLHQPDVSVAWDLGPHDFSILRYWLDELPTEVAAWSRGCVIPTIPDVAFINLAFPSGTIGHVEIAWLAPSKLRRTAIVGSSKMVLYDDTSPEPVRIFDSQVMLRDPASFGEFQLSYRTGDIVSPRVEPAEPLLRELEDFRLAVVEGLRPRSHAQLGLDVVRIVEAVERSLDLEGARVKVLDVDQEAAAGVP